MEKLNFDKKRVAVFLSGKGTNFKSLYRFSKLKKSKYKIVIVISNKKNTLGIAFAKKNRIKNFTLVDKINFFEKKINQNFKKI